MCGGRAAQELFHPRREALAYSLLLRMLATIRLGTSVARAARALEPADNLIRRLYRHRRSSSLVRQHHRVIADALEVYRPAPVEIPSDEREDDDYDTSGIIISYATVKPRPRTAPKRKIIGSPYVGSLLSATSDDAADDEEEDIGTKASGSPVPNTPARFTHLLAPGFAIYIDTPLRTNVVASTAHEGLDNDPSSEEESSTDGSPDGRLALGRIRDENLLWTTWRLGPLEA